jgi:hypothetical protein
MEKSKFIKDIPVGVLIIVLAQFVFYGAIYIAKFPNLWEMLGIVFLIHISSDMISFGCKLIKGYEYDSDE